MKRLSHFLFAVLIYQASESTATFPTDIDRVQLTNQTYLALELIPRTCAKDLGISTTPVACVQGPPVVSTGPFILKAGSGDCYRAEGINPNGTMLKSPLDWVACPQ